MPSNPTGTKVKLDQVMNAWATLATAKSLAGMTLDQFKAKIQPSLDARVQIDQFGAQLAAAKDARDDADSASMAQVQLVVNAVKGDPTAGEDSDLYEQMGYVRKSERASGLRRGTPSTVQTK
jgi:hypothetical protein